MNLDWLKPIDIYCERISAAFWAEPLNAFSNLSFIFTGLFFLFQLRKNGHDNFWIRWLSLMTIIVGVGSFLFHTFANFWSMWADVLPIMILMCTYFFYVLKKVFRFSLITTIFGLLTFFLVGFLLEAYLPRWFNGSISYAHAFASMGLTYWFTRHTNPIFSKSVKTALILFFISLVFRSTDMAFCESITIGTHFLWHLINGAMIGYLLKGVEANEFSS